MRSFACSSSDIGDFRSIPKKIQRGHPYLVVGVETPISNRNERHRPHLRPVATGRLRKGSSPVDSSIMSASYQPLREEAAAPVYSSKGHTSAEAAAEQLKWGKNEIPEEKESVREAAFCL